MLHFTDAQCTDDAVNKMIAQVQKKQKKFVFDYRRKLTLQQFKVRVENLQESLIGVCSVLMKFPVCSYRAFWIVELSGIIPVLTKDIQYFMNNFTSDFKLDYLSLMTETAELLSKLNHDFNNKVMVLLRNFDFFRSPLVVSQFSNLIQDTLNLVVVDKNESLQKFDNSLQLLESAQNSLLTHHGSMPFDLMVCFVKTTYLVGSSNLILPFIPDIFHAKLSINHFNSSSFKLIDLMNYHRYMAFHLVTLSLRDKSQNKQTVRQFNDASETHFRILLNFPNLASHIYTAFQFGKPNDNQEVSTKKQDMFLINLQERQEISWLYIINYLLRLTTIQQLSVANIYFRQEFEFLNRSLSASLSKDIDISASRHGSTQSSVISFVQLANSMSGNSLESPNGNKLLSHSLSSMFVGGSYKEKSNLIVNFIKRFNPNLKLCIKDINATLNGFENDQSSLRQLLGEETPGKNLYVDAIVRICDNITSLVIKFLVECCGINNIPTEVLKTTTNYKKLIFHLIDAIESLKYTRNNGIIHFELKNEPLNFDQNQLLHLQVQIHENTTQLKLIADRLK